MVVSWQLFTLLIVQLQCFLDSWDDWILHQVKLLLNDSWVICSWCVSKTSIDLRLDILHFLEVGGDITKATTEALIIASVFRCIPWIDTITTPMRPIVSSASISSSSRVSSRAWAIFVSLRTRASLRPRLIVIGVLSWLSFIAIITSSTTILRSSIFTLIVWTATTMFFTWACIWTLA